MAICSTFGSVIADFGSSEELDNFLSRQQWEDRKGFLTASFKRNEAFSNNRENQALAQQIVNAILANDYH